MNPKSDNCVPTAVRTHFGDVSKNWADRYTSNPRSMSDLDLILRRENAQDFMRSIIAESEEQLDVLDVGCGTGNALDGISREAIRVTGIDAVAEMVRVASHEHPEDRFFQAAVQDLPFEDHSADVVVCLGVLEYLVDPQPALDSFRRVLRPGGRLIVSFPNKKSLFRRVTRRINGIEDNLNGVRKIFSQKSRRPTSEPSYRHFQWSFNQSQSLLRNAGFAVLGCKFSNFGIWGRVGRLHVSMAVSSWLSRILADSRCFGGGLACTMVLHAQKAGDS